TAKDSFVIENGSTGEVNSSAISWFSAMPTTPQMIWAPPWPPLQPSEFAKLAVLIYMAAWLTAKGDQVRDVSLGVMPFVGMVGLVVIVVGATIALWMLMAMLEQMRPPQPQNQPVPAAAETK
ncbi:MAG: hypothetical protein ABMA01_09285, partial [Chthoniobacteraceae bacterium]